MSIEKAVAKNITELIRQSGKSVIALSKELEVHNSQIYAYMNADYLPGALMIIKLCKALDCTYEEILGKID